MNITQIEENIQKLIKSLNKDEFIFDFLLAYDQPKASITRLKNGDRNLSKIEGEVLWKRKIFFKATGEDLFKTFEEIKKDEKISKQSPRFILVTDFKNLLALDTKNQDRLDCSIDELPKHFDFFLPLAGMEKKQHLNENPADVKAAERMAKLYDEIKKNNTIESEEEVHNLNVFLSRLLFCYFAEDTGIFEDSQFVNAISSHTQEDGSDLNTYLDNLFEILNTETSKRKNIPKYLNDFPYVNGGLFRNKHVAPIFTRKSRQAIIEAGELDWKAIHPDIFGSMIQAVVKPDQRGGYGMHYTSVPNIMKVIEPLFLDELYETFEASKNSEKKLRDLLARIQKIKIFDPACGSGNFLIIAYKELRKLEMKIFQELKISMPVSSISLSNFYGIELDDFAHEIAILSLWLAEHQMDQDFSKTFGSTKPALPLKSAGNIIHGNAARLSWEEVCPKNHNDEIYLLGNPPYLGRSLRNKNHQEDMDIVFKGQSNYKDLDYITCWFLKGAKYIKTTNAELAFVSTNSIIQGTQVNLLWPIIFSFGTKISFCHTTFKWQNNAKSNAGVSVVIIGIASQLSKKTPRIFNQNTVKEVKNINPYLAEGDNVWIENRYYPISMMPEISLGNAPKDDGALLLTIQEYERVKNKYPEVLLYIKKFIGADEFINNTYRYCLWIEDKQALNAKRIPYIQERLEKCRTMRIKSKKIPTQKLAQFPYKFGEIRHQDTNSLIIPSVSSERRDYIPIGFLDNTWVVSNSAFVVYNAKPWLFGIISSLIHVVWVKALAGRLETRFRYSSQLCYNTFPFPDISEKQKEEINKFVHLILNIRESYSEKTYAQLYDPKTMPDELRSAHHQLDLAVEKCYRYKPFENDDERLEHLFKLYEQMIEEEKNKGTLFERETKPKKRKKINA
jgi:type I restriction-modification system DNA methylase subunit